MANLVISDVHIVAYGANSAGKFDAPSAEVFNFVPVRFDAAGKLLKANGTTTTTAAFEGIATVKSTRAGQAVTVIREGLVDVGNALSALAIGAAVYLSDTDGTLADTAGTVSTIVGRVVPGWGALTADRLLLVKKGG